MQDSPVGSDEEPARGHRFIGGRDLTHRSTPVGRGIAALHSRLGDRVRAHQALLLTPGVDGGLAVAARFGATRIYDAAAGSSGIASLDRPIMHHAMRLRPPGSDAAAAAIAEVFGPVGTPIIPAASASVIAVTRRHRPPTSCCRAAV